MKFSIAVLLLLLIQRHATAQMPVVQHRGKMSKIAQEGRLDAAIMVDTIKMAHLYAIGPVENLRGEIIVWDNKPFVAAVTNEKAPFLKKNVRNLKAIFLVYADIEYWDTVILEEEINSIQALQNAITQASLERGMDTSMPFPFLIYGKITRGKGHIMFKDKAVHTVNAAVLKEANHANTFADQHAQMLGFYSQHHQAVFTHHLSYIHIHYRLGNRYQAGHLDEVAFDASVPIRLLLPRKTPQK